MSAKKKIKHPSSRNIRVDYLARVEGEGAMYVKIRDQAVKDVQLKIFEPPRFFEAFLRGRSIMEAPDITARICGICPVAYQMSSCHAMEQGLGVKVGGTLRELRRLLYCGEWIESHALHAFLLHAPDFLGYESAIHMAKDYPDTVQMALKLKKLGNDLVTLLGGREIHPINVRVGGFYKVPEVQELRALGEEFKAALDEAEQAVAWSGELPFPDFERDYNFVALRHPGEYPFNEGHIVSSSGLDVPVESYASVFREIHVERSTALHSEIEGQGPYFTGPLARYNLNFDKLTPRAKAAAKAAGLTSVCKNPFQSIIVRLVETLYAYEEAIRIIDAYEKPDRPFVEIEPRACTGHGCTEAPRGILYHTYRMDDHGIIEAARIVPPTSQNQPTIEEDLREYVRTRVDLPDDKLQWQCEQAIRNYDPCISCSVHFLKLTVDRGD